MAFTKITNAGFGLTTGTLVGVAASFSSTVSVGGTLTYEDVTNVDSVGLITARSGISITGGDLTVPDAIIHDGDTNTRIRFPAADTFSVETAGNERLRIDSSGRLLVGTNSARANFLNGSVTGLSQVEGSGSGSSRGTLSVINNATTEHPATLLLGRSNANTIGSNTLSSNAQWCGRVGFMGNDGSEFVELASISGFVDGTPGANDMPGRLSFRTTADGASSPTERMRIDSSGNVGIKNTVAATIDAVNNAGTLVVGDGSSAEGITIYTSDSTSGELAFADGTSGSATQRGRIIYAHGDNSMRISTNGAEVLRIDSSGNVGIAINNPGETLDVGGKIRSHHASDSRFLLRVNDVNKGGFQASTDDGVVIYGASSTNPIKFQTSGAEKARIDTSGRLLVGTTTEGQANADNLTIADSANCGITIRTGTSSQGALFFSDATSGTGEYDGFITYDQGTRAMRFGTNASERMRIDSSGSMGLGTNSPAGNLHISGSGDRSLLITGGTSGTTSLQMGDSDDADIGAILYDNSNNSMQFKTNASERMRLDSSGRLAVGVAGYTGDAKLVVESLHSSGSIISEFRNEVSGNYGGMRILGGVLNRECRLQSLYGSSYFTFYTEGTGAATERMRITSAGNVGINYDSPTAKLEVKEDTSSAETTIFRIKSNWSASNQTQMLVLSDGDVENRNNAYRAISDAKLKENIVDASSQWEDIKNLRVRNYNFIEGAGDPTKTHIGLVAQEVEPISPGLVKERADEDENGNDLGTVTKSVNYSVLYMKAVKALQEAQTRIESLEARLDAGGL